MESPNTPQPRPDPMDPMDPMDPGAGPISQPEPSQDELSSSLSPHGPAAFTQPMNISAGEPSMDDTQISRMGDDVELPPEIDEPPGEAPRGGRRWILWTILGILLLALIAAGSAFAGYNSAIEERTRYQSTLVSGEAANQYILTQQDIALANYDRARQRLEYIIQIDPNYPGASDQLTFVLTQQRITASPTLAPTPTLTPTPDFRTRDELFAQAQNYLVGREWTPAIDALLVLRKNYADFMPVKVDGMLFVALRNRGIDKIARQQDLEGGNYDLTLAERFGPLDAEAETWREWAELYMRGASYWAVDWGQSAYYFSLIADAVPNLSDASGWTAASRYMEALLGYGNWLAARGEWCEAQVQYDTYMMRLADPQVEPTAVYVYEQCATGAGAPETPEGELTATPTPGDVAPTETIQPLSTPSP